LSVEFAPLLIEPAYRKVRRAIGARVLSRALREGERSALRDRAGTAVCVNRSTVREALRELESRGLVQRPPGLQAHVCQPAAPRDSRRGVSHALLLHDVTVRDVWEALTILEPPIARAAARERSAQDLECIVAAAAAFIRRPRRYRAAVQRSAQVFRCLGRRLTIRCWDWHRSRCLQLLEPSLRVMIDKVPRRARASPRLTGACSRHRGSRRGRGAGLDGTPHP